MSVCRSRFGRRIAMRSFCMLANDMRIPNGAARRLPLLLPLSNGNGTLTADKCNGVMNGPCMSCTLWCGLRKKFSHRLSSQLSGESMFRASVLNKVCQSFRQSFCRNMPDSRNSAVGKPQSGALRCIVFLVRCSVCRKKSSFIKRVSIEHESKS